MSPVPITSIIAVEVTTIDVGKKSGSGEEVGVGVSIGIKVGVERI